MRKDCDDKPKNNFERETRLGNGSPWNGLTTDTQPARDSVDKGKWAPEIIKKD